MQRLTLATIIFWVISIFINKFLYSHPPKERTPSKKKVTLEVPPNTKSLFHLENGDTISSLEFAMSISEAVKGLTLKNLSNIPNSALIKAFPRLESVVIEKSSAALDYSVLLKSLSRLDSLKHLALRDNAISKIIPKIGLLKNLESLDLSSNHLTKLPEEIKNCSKLLQLDLYDNPVDLSERKKILHLLPNTSIVFRRTFEIVRMQ